MKRLFRIIEISKNEQRVVLIAMFVLIAIAFVEYKRNVYHSTIEDTPPTIAQPSPTPAEIENEG